MIRNLRREKLENSVKIIKELGLELPEDVYNYALIRRMFARIARDKVNAFEASFYSTFKNMDVLADNCLSHGIEIILSIVELTVDKLVSMGLHDLNSDLFIKNYVAKYFGWAIDYIAFFEHYNSFNAFDLDKRKHVERQQEVLTRWAVLISWAKNPRALSEQVDAAFRKELGDIGKSLFKTIENDPSYHDKDKKKNLYNNPETLKYLSYSLYRACLNVHYAYCDVLLEASDEKIISATSLIKKEQYSIRLIENLNKGRIPESEVLNVLKDIILAFPYNPNIIFILSLSKQFSEIDLFEYADFFSIYFSDKIFSTSIRDIKRNVNEYSLEERQKLYQEFEELGVTNTILDNEVQKMKEQVLFYDNRQFKSIAELEQYCIDQELKHIERLKVEAAEQKANTEKIIRVFQVYGSNSSLHMIDIPAKQERNARKLYDIPDDERLIVLIDFTLMDSAKKGIAFCLKGMYCRSGSVNCFISYSNFSEIINIEKSEYRVYIDLLNDNKIELDRSGSSFNSTDLANAIKGLVREFTGKIVGSPEPEVSKKPEATPILEVSKKPEATPILEVSKKPEATPILEVSKKAEATPVTEVRKKNNLRYFVIIYVVIFPLLTYFSLVLSSNDLESLLSILIYIPVTMIYNILIAKEKGRSVVFWLIVSLVPFTPLILTLLNYTDEREDELDS
jgi:hypothetical protein